MELKKQVCSIQLAKKLRKLGVPQKSHVYWQKYISPIASKAYYLSVYDQGLDANNQISAFTVPELGEMLPQKIWTPVEFDILVSEKQQEEWGCFYEQSSTGDCTFALYAPTEADARAKMLIYLIENNLITV